MALYNVLHATSSVNLSDDAQILTPWHSGAGEEKNKHEVRGYIKIRRHKKNCSWVADSLGRVADSLGRAASTLICNATSTPPQRKNRKSNLSRLLFRGGVE